VSRTVFESAVVSDIFSRIAEFFGTDRGTVLKGLIYILCIWAGAWLAYQVVKRIARRIIHVVDHRIDSTMSAAAKRGHTIAEIVRSIGRIVILVGAVLLTAGALQVPIAPLLTFAGILGLAVSFGAQSLVKDLIAGFFFLFENQFAIGDEIEAGGKSGTVEHMSLRVVMLRDIRGVLHVIPNGQITTVSNLTRSWSRAVVEVIVDYAADLDYAIAVLRDELDRLRKDAAWRDRFQGDSEVTGVEELGPQGALIRTLLRTTPGAQWDVAREFRRRLKNRLDAEGVAISSPLRSSVQRPELPVASSPTFPSETA